MRQFFKRLQLKISPTWKGNSQSSPRGSRSPIQNKPKDKDSKTHTNQTRTKHKERILKAAKEKQQVTHKGNPICLTAGLSAETLKAKKEWQDIFKVLERKKSITKITVHGKDLIQN